MVDFDSRASSSLHGHHSAAEGLGGSAVGDTPPLEPCLNQDHDRSGLHVGPDHLDTQMSPSSMRESRWTTQVGRVVEQISGRQLAMLVTGWSMETFEILGPTQPSGILESGQI